MLHRVGDGRLHACTACTASTAEPALLAGLHLLDIIIIIIIIIINCRAFLLWRHVHVLLSCCAHVIRHFLAGLCFCASLALHPSKMCDVPSVLILTETAPKLGFLPTLCWQLDDVPLKSIPCIIILN